MTTLPQELLILSQQSVTKLAELLDLKQKVLDIVKDIPTEELILIIRRNKELKKSQNEFDDLLKQL